MDIDSSLLRDWEDETFVICDEDDNLDFAIASSLQSEYESRINSKFSSDEVDPKTKTFLNGLDEDLDYAFALSLQDVYDEDFKNDVENLPLKSVEKDRGDSKPLSIVDEQWELIDPHPDVHALFLEYDAKFFYGKLQGVEVIWSKRMTLCAGVCSYEGKGGLCSVRLSLPLLKLRPRRDLVETLLHEMIHAYLFVTHNNKDREGHGPEFLNHMNRINKETGTKITVYHSFHDEVDLYRQHWWKCDGPCKHRRPFFGVVKRAVNRAPGPNDNWWGAHQTSCGGIFVKIKEPENFKKRGSKRKADSKSKTPNSDIRGFLKDGNEIPKGFSSKGIVLNKGSSSSKGIGSSKGIVTSKDSKNKTPNSNIRGFLKNEKEILKGIVTSKGSGSSKGSSSSKNDSLNNASLTQPKPLKTKSSNVTTVSSLLKDNEVVSVRSEDIPTKKSFLPFQGNGHMLGGSSIESVIPPLWSLHRNLSGSQKVLEASLHSQTPKIPKLSSSSELKNSGSKFSTRHAPDNAAKKLIQSPMEKFFEPPKAPANKKVPSQKNTSPAGNSKKKETENTENFKVPCPICSMLVENVKINNHLDDCLKN